MRKLHAGKPHVQFERRTEASAQARLLRPDYPETTFWEVDAVVRSGPIAALAQKPFLQVARK